MSLGAAPLIPVKKLQHKDISHFFFCGVTLVGIKSMMLASCNCHRGETTYAMGWLK
jgi:hypothetical protein